MDSRSPDQTKGPPSKDEKIAAGRGEARARSHRSLFTRKVGVSVARRDVRMYTRGSPFVPITAK